MGQFSFVCTCGHVQEEHNGSGLFIACTLCDCQDFEGDDSDEGSDD